MGERGDQGLDLLIEPGDVGIQSVDPAQHLSQQEPVVVIEVPGERLPQCGNLASHPCPAISASTAGSRSPAISAAIISRPETPNMSEATTESLMQASSSSFSTLFFSAVRTSIRSTRQRVRSRSFRIGRGGTKLGRSICRSATLHNQTESSTSSPS